MDFYPRPPRGGRPWRTSGASCGRDFYPRPPRGGRQYELRTLPRWQIISIHALREEGDMEFACEHTLLSKFLSTPSARRATCAYRATPCWRSHFYPRPPRGGRPQHLHIHPPRSREFLSTPSARRATTNTFRPSPVGAISIHALREEGDSDSSARKRPCENFYPRPPRGGRPPRPAKSSSAAQFLSTPSARRATHDMRTLCAGCPISIHALREEGDSKNRDKISIFKQIIQHSARI